MIFGSVTRKKICQPLAPSVSAASSSSLPWVLHHRQHLARDEREGHEGRRQHDARHREDDVDVVRRQPRAEHALRARTAARRSGPRSPANANGRSISVISSALAAEAELGDQPRGGDAEHQVERHRDGRGRAASAGSPHSVSGSLIAVEVGRRALAKRLGEHRDQRQRPGTGPGTAAPTPISSQRTRTAGRAGPRRSAEACAPVMRRFTPRRRPACSTLIASSSDERRQQHHHRDRRRARVVVLLQLGHDQQRRDLGLHRHVAGDEDDRAVLADARARTPARSRSAAPAATAGRITRAKRLQRDGAQRRGRLLQLASRSSSTGCTVRTTNGSPTKISAIDDAERRVRDLDAERLEERARASRSARRARSARCPPPRSAARTAGRPARRRSALPGNGSAPAPRPRAARTRR